MPAAESNNRKVSWTTRWNTPLIPPVLTYRLAFLRCPYPTHPSHLTALTASSCVPPINRMEALQEPAILHIIFLELTPWDLLRVQRVCLNWRAAVINSTELLTILWLHPGNGKLCQQRIPGPNPLLSTTAFEAFFDGHGINGLTGGRSNVGLWADLAADLLYVHSDMEDGDRLNHQQRRERFMRPEASWRRMLPCWPPTTELQVILFNGYDGVSKLARLVFNNSVQQVSLKEHPSYLTFGLIYDLAEITWFQGQPNWPSSAEVSSSIFGRWTRDYIVPTDALVSDEFRKSILPRIGLVCMDFTMKPESAAERLQMHHDAYARQVSSYAYRWRKVVDRQGLPAPPKRPHVFTNEFHFDDGLSFEDIAWDDVQEFCMPAERPWVVRENPNMDRLRRSRGGVRDRFSVAPYFAWEKLKARWKDLRFVFHDVDCPRRRV